jgi:hypothetical protein
MRSRTALWALLLAVVPLRGTAEGQPVLSIDKAVPLSQDGASRWTRRRVPSS